MPLYARPVAAHDPDGKPSPSPDDFVILSASYEAGSFHRIAHGPGEGRWLWAASLGGVAADV